MIRQGFEMIRERIVDGVSFTFGDCITCGITYCVTTSLFNHHREKGGYHHCPNGHQQGWSKTDSEIERLRRERDNAKQQIARAEDEAREARARAEKAELATRKLKKRAAVGTCPCCQRTFSNMNTHMRKKHPDYVKDAINVIPDRKVLCLRR